MQGAGSGWFFSSLAASSAAYLATAARLALLSRDNPNGKVIITTGFAASSYSIRRQVVLERAKHSVGRHLQRPQTNRLDPLMVGVLHMMRERSVRLLSISPAPRSYVKGRANLLGDTVKEPDVVGRPAAVELAQGEVEVAADRDQGAVAVDEGDDGADEGVVDIREVRGEELLAASAPSRKRRRRRAYRHRSFQVLEPDIEIDGNLDLVLLPLALLIPLGLGRDLPPPLSHLPPFRHLERLPTHRPLPGDPLIMQMRPDLLVELLDDIGHDGREVELDRKSVV